ncbi:hypothetical protein MBLNU459_g0930t1 [Dothideomycetes sp. NU459]
MANQYLEELLGIIVINQTTLSFHPVFDPSTFRNYIFPYIAPKAELDSIEDLGDYKKRLKRARKPPDQTAIPYSRRSNLSAGPSEAVPHQLRSHSSAGHRGLWATRPAHLKPRPQTLEDMATRFLTQSNSKLSSQDLIAVLSDDESWSALTDEDQRKLYEMLPTPDSAVFIDHSVHPLKGPCADHVKHFLREWQRDLKEGRKTKTWTDAAQQASGERADGKFDEWKEREKEAYWGQKGNRKEGN